MRASVVDTPTFRASTRRLGRAPRGPISPIQLLECEPDAVDHSFLVNITAMDFAANASDSRTTYMISVDSGDLEVVKVPPVQARRQPPVPEADRSQIRKLVQHRVGRASAGLQGGDLHAFFCRPLAELKGGPPAAGHRAVTLHAQLRFSVFHLTPLLAYGARPGRAVAGLNNL
jgi:hypothetical protein